MFRPLLLAIVMCSPQAEAGSLPDPTAPPRAHQAMIERLHQQTPNEFHVSAIKLTETTRKAIVNGVLVGVGDQVAGATVLEIVPGAVVLDYLSRNVRVSLLGITVRQAAEVSPVSASSDE